MVDALTHEHTHDANWVMHTREETNEIYTMLLNEE